MTIQYPSTSAAPTQCCEYHDKKNCKKSETQNQPYTHQLPTIYEIRSQPWSRWGVIIYVILAALLLLGAISEVVITTASSILTKEIDTDNSGRLAGTVLLAVCAAITFVAVSYALYAVRKKDHKTLQFISAIIVVMVVVQVLVVVFAVTIKKTDNMNLQSKLSQSFILAASKKDEPSVKMWDSMQRMLECCGLNGPDDYKDPVAPFAPVKIPFSCCPSAHSNESQFYMKLQRHLCIINKSYFPDGCNNAVMKVFKKTVEYVSITSLVFIVLGAILSGVGFFLVKNSSTRTSKQSQSNDNSDNG